LTGAWLFAGVLLAHQADVLHEEALRLLQSGSAPRAEEKVREAIARSQRFVPEEEIGARPDRGLLFEDMILEARKSYRARRARYFRTLGDALAAQEKWGPSRKAYRRALDIEEVPGLSLLMARQPDLGLESRPPTRSFGEPGRSPRGEGRLDLLLDAYLAPGSDRAQLERELLSTGAFLDRNALKASLDRKRFGKLRESHPDLELLDSSFPDFQATADGGPLIPAELFRAGSSLVAYFPVDGCGRCSEELDGISIPLRDALKRRLLIEVAAFVPESDLPVARRVARLLSLPVRVARKDSLPPATEPLEGGEIRFVARGGMVQIRIPLGDGLASAEIRSRAQAILSFLEEPGLPTEAEPEDASVRIVSLSRETDERRAFGDWIGTIAKLEAGPAPLDSLYSELNRVAQRVAPTDRVDALALLKALSPIRGSHAAKARFLGLAGDRVGEKLLEAAKALDASVRRTPAGEEGVFFVAVEGNRVYLQRSFHAEGGLRDFDFVLETAPESLAVAWGARQENRPLGVESVTGGGAFFYGCEERCPGARLWAEGKIVFEGGPAAIVDGELVELRSALVDAPPGRVTGPVFHRSAAVTGETPLERGLRLFEEKDFSSALLAFEQAEKEIDPVAPYDSSDLAYDRARALQEQGKRREALAIFRSLGDVTYQSLVDEKARLIESGR
jgi:tetratricopeptide (TPR) repeat protein